MSAPATASAEPLIRIRNLAKHYVRGEQIVPVLHDINLDIPEGDFIGLMGPSGSASPPCST
jgi:ABC-type antimicrobial peptide transport system, ATPase component